LAPLELPPVLLGTFSPPLVGSAALGSGCSRAVRPPQLDPTTKSVSSAPRKQELRVIS
jgi:hypothetical protein